MVVCVRACVRALHAFISNLLNFIISPTGCFPHTHTPALHNLVKMPMELRRSLIQTSSRAVRVASVAAARNTPRDNIVTSQVTVGVLFFFSFWIRAIVHMVLGVFCCSCVMFFRFCLSLKLSIIYYRARRVLWFWKHVPGWGE